ncbi:MAG: right-handed parallel beta-helix repeat-containing protein [Methanospirillum sp.]|uniref:NosD domain-containing protein n=1 Tax=Methanospirillum sp. TaxID=45200 RepID=UPI00236D864A|nr:NosD domain-containing protein [Methanospirillum sp.]MDD1728288.1 right-handed parallel beta-helix repeat-containing protein [Methanospirillum sp.]
MYLRPDFVPKLCLYLLFLSAAGMAACVADSNISISGPDAIDLNSSLLSFPRLDNLSIPAPPVQINDLRKTDSGAENNNQIVSTLAVIDTGMNTMGNAVLVPITPTPEGSGYSYYNTTGTDPGYLIYASGTYTLLNGFSTENSSALRIVASDVVLDGNAQTILGNSRNVGITINSGKTNTTVRKFVGIRGFYKGIDSFGDQVSLTNNSLSDNYYGGIRASGSDFSMSRNVLFNNTDFGVFMEGTGATLTENSIHDNEEFGLYLYSGNITLDKNVITRNGDGIICEGNNPVIHGNIAEHNDYIGIGVDGNGAIITDNVIRQNNNNLLSYGSNTTIVHNEVSSSTTSYGLGIYSVADNATILENTVSNNGYGIAVGGDNCMVTNNWAYTNNIFGINVDGTNGTISKNIIRDTTQVGMVGLGNNFTILDNIVTKATIGADITDIYNNYTIIGNQFTNTSQYGIFIENSRRGTGEGVIYNNFFGSQTNVGGFGNFSNYSYIWTNPAGPQRGTNVVGGPIIAGNYWSNPTETGWSDQQTPNVSGYTTTPYEVVSEMYDTAPLVP